MKAKEIEQLFAEICKSLNTSTPRIDLPSYNEMMSSFKKMCPYHQFDDGCEKVILVLSRPLDFRKKTRKTEKFSKVILKDYPKTVNAIYNRADKYNEVLTEILKVFSIL